MKHYKVWVKVSVEEYNSKTKRHRNVTNFNGAIVDDPDPEEMDIMQTPDYAIARSKANDVIGSLVGSTNPYVAAGGCACPVCGSSEISGGPIDKEDSVYIQEMSCSSCEATWNDVLKLEDISDLQYGKRVVELKLGGTSYGKQAINRQLDTVVGDLIHVDIKGAPDSDQLYCEDQLGFRYRWWLPETDGYAVFIKI